MKRTILGMLAVAAMGTVSAQTEPTTTNSSDSYQFIDINAGVRVMGNNSSDTFDLNAAGFHADLGFGYMFNPKIGIKVQLGVDQFGSTMASDASVTSSTIIYNGSAQVVLSIAEMASFRSEKFDLILHAGGGLSSIANKEFRESGVDFSSDKGLKGNDDGINALIGINPKIGLGDHTFFNIDISYNMLFMQGFTVERFYGQTFSGMAGYPTISAGLTFTL